MYQPRKNLTGWCVVFTLFALVTACSSTQPPQDTSQSTATSNSGQETVLNPASASLPATHNIGEIVAVKDKDVNLQFKVNGIREHLGQGVIKPNSGSKWIVVSTTIFNKGEEPITLSVVSFELMDSNQERYEVALLAAALEDVQSPTGSINPGEERRGEVAFEVPDKAKGLKMLFQPNRSDCEAVAANPKASQKLHCEPVAINLK